MPDSDESKRLDLIKLSIMAEIEYDRAFYGYTPGELATKIGLAQSDTSDLLNGKTKRFSVDRLLTVLMRLGHDPSVYPTQ